MRCTGLVAWPEISDSSSNNSSSATEARTSTMSASARADPPTRRIAGSNLRQQRSDSTDISPCATTAILAVCAPPAGVWQLGKESPRKAVGKAFMRHILSFKNARSVHAITAPTAIENTQYHQV